MKLEQRIHLIIKHLREQRGLSAAEVARKSGISPSAISMIESAKRFPSTPILKKLALTLSTTIDYLLGEESFQEAEEKVTLRNFSLLSPKEQKYIMKQMAALQELSNEI